MVIGVRQDDGTPHNPVTVQDSDTIILVVTDQDLIAEINAASITDEYLAPSLFGADGVALSFSRSDHRHAGAAPSSIALGENAIVDALSDDAIAIGHNASITNSIRSIIIGRMVFSGQPDESAIMGKGFTVFPHPLSGSATSVLKLYSADGTIGAIGVTNDDRLNINGTDVTTQHAALTTGVHGAGAGSVVTTTGSQTLASKTLTTPTVSATGFTNAQHAHAAANSGGVIPHANLSGIGTTSHANIDSHIASLTAHGEAGGSVPAANFNVTSTTVATITNCSFSIGANEVWEIDFSGITFMSTGTGGIKFNVSSPAGSAGTIAFFGDTTAKGTQDFSKVAVGVATSAFGAYGAVNGYVKGSGVISNGATPGTVAIQAGLITGGNVGVLEAYITHFTGKRLS